MYYLLLLFLIGTATSLNASGKPLTKQEILFNRVEQERKSKRDAEKQPRSNLTAAQRNIESLLFQRVEAARVRKHREDKKSSKR